MMFPVMSNPLAQMASMASLNWWRYNQLADGGPRRERDRDREKEKAASGRTSERIDTGKASETAEGRAERSVEGRVPDVESGREARQTPGRASRSGPSDAVVVESRKSHDVDRTDSWKANDMRGERTSGAGDGRAVRRDDDARVATAGAPVAPLAERRPRRVQQSSRPLDARDFRKVRQQDVERAFEARAKRSPFRNLRGFSRCAQLRLRSRRRSRERARERDREGDGARGRERRLERERRERSRSSARDRDGRREEAREFREAPRERDFRRGPPHGNSTEYVHRPAFLGGAGRGRTRFSPTRLARPQEAGASHWADWEGRPADGHPPEVRHPGGRPSEAPPHESPPCEAKEAEDNTASLGADPPRPSTAEVDDETDQLASVDPYHTSFYPESEDEECLATSDPYAVETERCFSDPYGELGQAPDGDPADVVVPRKRRKCAKQGGAREGSPGAQGAGRGRKPLNRSDKRQPPPAVPSSSRNAAVVRKAVRPHQPPALPSKPAHLGTAARAETVETGPAQATPTPATDETTHASGPPAE